MDILKTIILYLIKIQNFYLWIKYLLGEYQKKNLQNLDLNNKIEICPLVVYEQKINYKDQLIINEPITFISCSNLTEIKNNLLMIDFISEFNKITERKIKFILIGDGNLKKIIYNLNKNPKITYQHYDRVDNFVDFLKKSSSFFSKF